MSRWAWALVLLMVGCRHRGDPAVIGTGTTEVREVDVSPIVPARVVRVWVDEGEPVRVGDTLASLTQSTTRADIAQREAALGAAEASLREALAGPRSREIHQAEAQLRMSEAEAARAVRDLDRTQPLAENGTVSRQSLDAARAASAAAVARRDANREALQLLREGTRPERIQEARAQVASARAELEAARAVAQDLVLTATVDGLVISRNAEPGEMLAAGQSVLTLGETSSPYVRVYISTRSLPRVRLGQRATAVLDGFPSHPITGQVVAIDPQAEFTPRVALTEEERADLVFGVKVALRDTTGLLKPGLPATVRIATGDAQ
jgi:HlyD family secretion protein